MAQRVMRHDASDLVAIEADLKNNMAEINARTEEIKLRRAQGRGREVARLEQDMAAAWAERRNLLRKQKEARELAVYGPAKPQRRRAR